MGSKLYRRWCSSWSSTTRAASGVRSGRGCGGQHRRHRPGDKTPCTPAWWRSGRPPTTARRCAGPNPLPPFTVRTQAPPREAGRGGRWTEEVFLLEVCVGRCPGDKTPCTPAWWRSGRPPTTARRCAGLNPLPPFTVPQHCRASTHRRRRGVRHGALLSSLTASGRVSGRPRRRSSAAAWRWSSARPPRARA